MVEPITLTIVAVACAVFNVVKTVYDMICKFFENINASRLAKIFRQIGNLVREYRRDGWLTSSREYTNETLMLRDEAFIGVVANRFVNKQRRLHYAG